MVTAVGCLSTANQPEFPGADTFAGLSLHTGNWPREPVDLAGKRVAVIGTGASGIQAIPVIAEQAAHLTVFQRTAQFTIPAENGPLDQQFVALWKQNYPEWRRRARHSRGGFPYTPSVTSALEVSAAERRATFEAAWGAGGFTFLSGTFRDLVLNEEANETAADFVRSKIDEIVRDPQVAEMLKPRDFPIGTKRLPLDTNYYETFNRPNVTLVDLKRTPVEEITPTGIRTSAGHHDLDVIVYATGFDALTGPLEALGIRGRGGRALRDAWREGPRTYLGVAVPGFPNLFTITGPGSPSVLSQHAGVDRAARGVDRRLPGLAARARGRGRSRRPSRRRPTGPTTCSRSPATPCTRRPRPGTWAPTSPASPGSSCRTSGASAPTATGAPRWPRTGTRASLCPAKGAEDRWRSTRRPTALLEQLAASGGRPLHELTPAEARGRHGRDARRASRPGPDMASVRDTRVRASGGFVPVRVLVPVARPRGVIVYYHGGGWVIGGLATSTSSAACSRSGPGARWSWSTTGSRPSTASRPPWTTRGRRCAGPTSTARNSPGGQAGPRRR